MNKLNEEIESSKGHLLYLIDVHIFSKVCFKPTIFYLQVKVSDSDHDVKKISQ